MASYLSLGLLLHMSYEALYCMGLPLRRIDFPLCPAQTFNCIVLLKCALDSREGERNSHCAHA
jgi:hypothetical protein